MPARFLLLAFLTLFLVSCRKTKDASPGDSQNNHQTATLEDSEGNTPDDQEDLSSFDEDYSDEEWPETLEEDLRHLDALCDSVLAEFQSRLDFEGHSYDQGQSDSVLLTIRYDLGNRWMGDLHQVVHRLENTGTPTATVDSLLHRAGLDRAWFSDTSSVFPSIWWRIDLLEPRASAPLLTFARQWYAEAHNRCLKNKTLLCTPDTLAARLQAWDAIAQTHPPESMAWFIRSAQETYLPLLVAGKSYDGDVVGRPCDPNTGEFLPDHRAAWNLLGSSTQDPWVREYMDTWMREVERSEGYCSDRALELSDSLVEANFRG